MKTYTFYPFRVNANTYTFDANELVGNALCRTLSGTYGDAKSYDEMFHRDALRLEMILDMYEYQELLKMKAQGNS
jgi:hypothetical protein